jgi:hypothetical protein
VETLVASALFAFASLALGAVPDYKDSSRLARLAAPAPTSGIDASLDGKLVAVSGPIESDETIGDPGGLVARGERIVLVRVVERYERHTDLDRTVDGRWEHERYEEKTFTVSTATIGSYSFHVPDASVDGFEFTRLELDPGKHRPLACDATYVYPGNGPPAAPNVGDERYRYLMIPRGRRVTLFGRASGSRVVPDESSSEPRYLVLASGGVEAGAARLRSVFLRRRLTLVGLAFLFVWGGSATALSFRGRWFWTVSFLGAAALVAWASLVSPLATSFVARAGLAFATLSSGALAWVIGARAIGRPSVASERNQ